MKRRCYYCLGCLDIDQVRFIGTGPFAGKGKAICD
jgi:hypothetical protein